MNSKATVKREAGGAWIEGVPGLKWGSNRDCTFIGALEAALAVTERPFFYSDLMGLSSLAFRMRWWDKDAGHPWCPSVAIGEMPKEQQRLGRLTGWGLPTDTQFGSENEDKAPIVKKIKDSIDEGFPVLAYVSTLDVGVVFGYEQGGKVLLARDYHCKEPVLKWPSEKIGPMQIYLVYGGKSGTWAEDFEDSLGLAIRNYKRGRGDGGVPGRTYLYGDLAFDYWIKDIERFEDFSRSEKATFLFVSAFAHKSLLDARRSAVKYLTEHATSLGPAARPRLLKAREHYEYEVDWHLASGTKGAARLASWEAGGPAAFPATVRKQQVSALAAIQKLERQAIGEIEKALGAL